MTDLDRIRREVQSELAQLAPTGAPAEERHRVADTRLEAEIGEVLRDEGLSDVAIEWLLTSASDVALRPTFASNSVDRILSTASAPVPDLRVARENRAISIPRATEMLDGIAPGFFERLEQGPGLGWLRVGAASVGTYLDALGIARGAFVRAMSPAVRSYAGEHPWGYRPGAVAEGPVDVTDERELLREASAWATSLLSIEPADAIPDLEPQEVFGFRWSPSDVRRRTRSLARAAHEAILREEMLSERDVDWEALAASANELLILLTDHGRRLPAFQFDADHRTVKPLVAEINERLGAGTDPWGVASWWFTPSGYLGGRPVDVLSASDDADRLRAAVRFLDADPG